MKGIWKMYTVLGSLVFFYQLLLGNLMCLSLVDILNASSVCPLLFQAISTLPLTAICFWWDTSSDFTRFCSGCWPTQMMSTGHMLGAYGNPLDCWNLLWWLALATSTTFFLTTMQARWRNIFMTPPLQGILNGHSSSKAVWLQTYNYFAWYMNSKKVLLKW